MYQKFNTRSIERASWFADLSDTLLQAESLLSRLQEDRGRCDEKDRLALQIRVIRAELEGMNRVALAEDRIVSQCWPLSQSAAGC